MKIDNHHVRDEKLYTPHKSPEVEVAELADAMDLKSIGGNTLRVQVPPAPFIFYPVNPPGSFSSAIPFRAHLPGMVAHP